MLVIILKTLAGLCVLALVGLVIALQSDELDKWKKQIAMSAMGVFCVGIGLVLYLEQIQPFIWDDAPIKKAKKGGGGAQDADDDGDGRGNRQSSASSSAPAAAPEKKPAKPKATIIQDCDDCPEMVKIVGGEFDMGAHEDDAGAQPNEYPVIEDVKINTFAIGRIKLTAAQYVQFTSVSGHRASTSCAANTDAGTGLVKLASAGPKEQAPAVCVSWINVIDYASWLSKKTGHRYRLPSASEWEYVARGAGGSDSDDGAAVPRDLATDMLATPGEWVEDCWAPSLVGMPRDGSAWTQQIGCERIVKGAWHDRRTLARASERSALPVTTASNGVGFRLARDMD